MYARFARSATQRSRGVSANWPRQQARFECASIWLNDHSDPDDRATTFGEMDSAALSGRTSAAVSRGPARGVACLPPPLRTTPYQALLHDALRDHGFAVVPGATVKVGSLVRNVRRVSVLHVHWPESYWRHPTPAVSWVKVGLLAARLRVAR